MRAELYPQMLELLGETDAQHFVENWLALVTVCESGEMRQGYYRAQKRESARLD